jgi:hypothetical protein
MGEDYQRDERNDAGVPSGDPEATAHARSHRRFLTRTQQMPTTGAAAAAAELTPAAFGKSGGVSFDDGIDDTATVGLHSLPGGVSLLHKP